MKIVNEMKISFKSKSENEALPERQFVLLQHFLIRGSRILPI